MAQTLAQKLIAKAAGVTSVAPDEIVTCRVDLLMMHDLQGPRRVGPMLEKLGAPIWDIERVVVVSDHHAPAIDLDSAGILDFTRKWVQKAGIKHFYDMQGISHILLPERGHLRPDNRRSGTRWNARDVDRSRRDPAANRVRRVRGDGRGNAGGGRGLHYVYRAQLQGTHGRLHF